MIEIKENSEFQQWIGKRRLLLLSSEFATSMRHEQYKVLHKIVNVDKHISMTIILLYLVRKGHTAEAVQCMYNYGLVRAYANKQWITHVATLKFLRFRQELQMIEMPSLIKIFVIYLLNTMSLRKHDFTAIMAISKFLKVSSTKVKQINEIIRG